METLINKSVVLLSGGIDSSTTLAFAKSEGRALYALSFDYGQRHKRELVSARRVAESLGVDRHLVISFDLREIGGSALTSKIKVPKDSNKVQITSYRFNEDKNSGDPSVVTRGSSIIPVTYVPARNTIFLSFALAWAEVLEAEDIFIGANAVDYSGYPDCRPEYLAAFEGMANLATKASIEERLRFRIRAPLLMMTKAEIIRKGTELGLDYSLTWSCYDPQPVAAGVQGSKFKVQKLQRESSKIEAPDSERVTGSVPCGRCDSCLFRQKGFEEAGLKDPLLSV